MSKRSILLTLTFLFSSFLSLPLVACAGDTDWRRIDLGKAGLSAEMPARWEGHTTSGGRLMIREPWRGDHRATMTAHLSPQTQPLHAWVDFAIEQDLLVRYPSAKVADTFEMKNDSDYPARGVRLQKLGGEWAGYDLLVAMCTAERTFVYLSMYVDSGAAAKLRPVLDRIVRTVAVAEGGSYGDSSTRGASREQRRPSQHSVTTTAAAPDQIAWESDFDEAFAMAARRNVPVFIAFGSDNEPVCETLATSLYRNREVVKKSRDFVCLIASPDTHAESGPCPRYGHGSCCAHQAIEIKARERYIRSRIAVAPQHLFCAPDGTLVARREYALSKSDLLGMMRDARRSVRLVTELAQDATLEERFAAITDPIARHGLIADALRSGGDGGLDQVLALAASMADQRKPDNLMLVLDGIGFARHESTAPLAVDHLAHSASRVRNHAAVALELIRSKDALPAILDALDRERSPAVRKNLLRAAGACAHGAPDVAELLLETARRGKALHRRNAILALRYFGDDATVAERLVEQTERERSTEIREVAAFTLLCLGDEAGSAKLGRAKRESNRIGRTAAKRMRKPILNAPAATTHGPSSIEDWDIIRKLGDDLILRNGSHE